MNLVNPYISFNGKCREAMEFYKLCLGGTLKLMAVKDSPMADQWPGNVQEHILHSTLEREGLMIHGSDMNDSDGFHQGNSMALTLYSDTPEELRNLFEKLSEGGRITHELHTFFGGTIGSITDRFGVNWIFKN